MPRSDAGRDPIATLRLSDRVVSPMRVLFVGINPGVRSAQTGHHFAGYSNRFWKLLFESSLTPVLLRAEDDGRLVEWGYGITNLVPRPTPGIDTLKREEFVAGRVVLEKKVRRLRPQIVALVGLTLYRFVLQRSTTVPLSTGLQGERFGNSRVYVLPNPSGRNAHFSYAEMLDEFRGLAHLLTSLPVTDRA